ncbi:glycerol-3-phosphate dehydrogenase/oxidase [Nitrogeniibacter mangrovi]|uniref:Glycerol-3-phosphate dehydrogenase/oxidase n=1 Tax=Nitrogeniibacter mangrovi TaxID=2016596 RepID=A0A6C1B5A0_9RHOO|nr:glycerol-3-phosphate dehydrogenase/oxidase [Nitrogeniibacter mangrovi]QID18647.1 glycerol-3-phosphate dehydrogenase/oxidase [Nitrogeniibacter mangrovi]
MAPDDAPISPLARPQLLARADAEPDWDVIVIGGGATGLGAALDAASRGYRTLLLEGHDFAKGTSSRSTKLVHGGVRYLEQGRIGLVREALVERFRLLRNAPQWVHPLRFVVPVYSRWDRLKLRVGLGAYSLLAGRYRLGPVRTLSRDQALQALPNIRRAGLLGAITYVDAQFDDAALAVALAQSVFDQGGTALNYMPVIGLQVEAGRVVGVRARDAVTGRERSFSARVVINAAGVWVDAIRRMACADLAPMIAPSQGVHLVVDAHWLPGQEALLVPETEDGRVLFMIPWRGKVLLGTTDTALDDLPMEPQAREAEIDFILRTAASCLARAPRREDVLSVFAGLRPLIAADPSAPRSELSREHVIRVEQETLVTIAGGKWTTYRQMAEEVVDRAARAAGLQAVTCRTAQLPVSVAGPAREAGAEVPLHPRLDLTAAQVRHAVRAQFALHVEDVLARRHRALFLDAAAAIEVAPEVARLMAEELDRDAEWQGAEVAAFTALAAAYRCGAVRR